MNVQADTGGLLRVSSQKIGQLMDLVSELSLGLAETLDSADLQGLELPRFRASALRLGQILREVQDAATDLRLVPVDETFRRLGRMLREIERQTGKRIDLVTKGADTLIDKLVADRLYDPLLHVLRNSADHGIETPAARAAAGKPEAGRILLQASQWGGEVRITVADDGRGLDRDRILARARERGLIAPDDDPEPARLWRVIFAPGFSTAETVSALSGRGVGMDVLNTTMTALRGRINIDSTAGQGTRVSLHIPVSLSFLDCIVVAADGCLYAVPIDAIEEIRHPDPADLMPVVGGGEVLRGRDSLIPLRRLERFYGRHRRTPSPAGRQVTVVLVTSSGPVAVPVDRVIDRQTVVMKPLSGPLAQVRAGFGAALLGTGEVALVLDAEALAEGDAA